MNKWAEICVNILRHYNEGWAKGFHWNISYASLWEEPDNSSLFAGSFEEFLELYRNFSLKIKKAFPDVKVGGPQAIASNTFRAFFSFCRTYSLPLDFAGTTNYTLAKGNRHCLSLKPCGKSEPSCRCTMPLLAGCTSAMPKRLPYALWKKAAPKLSSIL